MESGDEAIVEHDLVGGVGPDAERPLERERAAGKMERERGRGNRCARRLRGDAVGEREDGFGHGATTVAGARMPRTSAR